MIEIYEQTKVYVLWPAYSKTGGPELLHQLVHVLSEKGIEAYLVYTNTQDDNTNYTPEDFKVYNFNYILEKDIEDKKENVVIIPETRVRMIKNFNNIRKVIWWLSVDNYQKLYTFKKAIPCGFMHVLYLLKDGTLISHRKDYKKADYHLCQSYYAIDFLQRKKVSNIAYLSDYINDTFMKENANKQKSNKVLYNPKKGYRFTKRIIKRANDLEWVPIKNLTTTQVKELLLQSKVYIDFGNHPGKDRFPREAAMCGCVIITGKRGSAKFCEDVPIDDVFKFKDSRKNINKIVTKIKECLNNYDTKNKKFENYRNYIKGEKEQFKKDIDTIFVKVGVSNEKIDN